MVCRQYGCQTVKSYLLILCQYVQVVKLNEQMLSIIAMVLTLNPQVSTQVQERTRLSDLCTFHLLSMWTRL